MNTKKGPLKTTIHIALLRAINVGGHRPVTMAVLLDLLTQLGFDGAQSLLQSGNLVFRSQERTALDLEEFLEEEAAKRLQLRTDFLVRSAEEWKQIVASNPFQDEAKRDAARLVVTFLKCAPSAKDVKALRAAIRGPEIAAVDGRQAYIVYPAGIGRSRLTNTLIEKNWAPEVPLATGKPS
jgi:uncharacterized protein (DUF1697 family)